ncbi:MAG: hypothetical protein IKL04_05880 [Lachnospiraceae bacterium]|nr:hypothetical protein [Lachnospiraceae bacterium]
MKKKLLHNWTLKLASLIVAFLLWFMIIQFEQPMDKVTFSNVKVNLINTELLDNGNKYYEVLNDTDMVRVTVKAPRNVTEKLSASDIIAVADVNNLTNINTIEIDLDVPNEEVYSVTANHDAVRLHVENRASKWVRVNYGTTGEVAAGYMVTDVSPDQTLVEISGPASAVAQVSYAGVQLSVEGATNSISANVDVSLYNEAGNLLHLNTLSKNVDFIHMDVRVLAAKEVPLDVRTSGKVAEGYLLTGEIETSPEKLMLAGSAATLNGISKVTIPGELVDISGASADVVKVIDIREYLPENIELASKVYNGRIKVTVHVEAEEVKDLQIPVGNIDIRNVPEGFAVMYPEEITECTVKISGLKKNVEALQPVEVSGYVDVAEWMREQEITELVTGTYIIPVVFEKKEGIVIENEVSVTVNVEARY